MLDLDNGILPNKLAYYISGDRYAAKTLKLRLNMNMPEGNDSALDSFVEAGRILFKKALALELGEDLAKVLHNGLDAQGQLKHESFGEKNLTVERQDFPNQKNSGYSINFVIAAKSTEE